MSIPAAVVVLMTYSAIGISAVMMIKNIAEGNYVGALMAGVGMATAFAGLGAAQAASTAANTANAANATVTANATLGTMGAAPTAAVGTMSAAPVAAGITPAASLMSSTAPTVGLSSSLPSMASAVAPTTSTVTVPAIQSSQGFVGKVVDGIKNIGGGLFEELSSGNILNTAGKVVKQANGVMNTLQPFVSTGLEMYKDKQNREDSEDVREEEKATIDAYNARVNFRPQTRSLTPRKLGV